MTEIIYDTIEHIPYDLFKQGGTFKVRFVPAEMNAQNLGMGYVPLPPLPAGDPGELPRLPTIAALAPFAGLIVTTICAIAIAAAITTVIWTIKAVPEGEVLDVLENGDRVFQSSDGSNWLLHPDGSQTQIGGPTAVNIEALAIVLIIGVIAVIIGLVVLKITPEKIIKKIPGFKKEPEKTT